MVARKHLWAASEDEKPPTPEPEQDLTVTQAAESGTPRQLMVAMRKRIAKAVEDPNTPARDLAALTKRLVEVQRDIEAIDARAKQEAEESAAEAQDGAFDEAAI